MSERSRFGGWIAALFILALLAVVGFGAFQLGVAQGAGGMPMQGWTMHAGPHGFTYFPFFWGFGFLRFAFTLLVLFIVFRLLFFPFRMMRRHGGPWGHDSREGWQSRMKEIHDRWHAEHPEGSEAPPPEE